MVVLPTGGGKTLLFLLPVVVESGHFTTVVICPFVALKKDMLHHLENAKISIQVYSESMATGAVGILLVSIEHCLSEALQNHLGYLYKMSVIWQ
jgi:superfamily II DNA helicase RecQ